MCYRHAAQMPVKRTALWAFCAPGFALRKALRVGPHRRATGSPLRNRAREHGSRCGRKPCVQPICQQQTPSPAIMPTRTGRLAQRERRCFTRIRSGVQIPHRPPWISMQPPNLGGCFYAYIESDTKMVLCVYSMTSECAPAIRSVFRGARASPQGTPDSQEQLVGQARTTAHRMVRTRRSHQAATCTTRNRPSADRPRAIRAAYLIARLRPPSPSHARPCPLASVHTIL